MIRLRDETHKRRGHALKSAISVCVLVGALVGVTMHDAEHAFGEDDAPCAVCLLAERLDGAAKTSPSIARTHAPATVVDIPQGIGEVSLGIAWGYRPRAPPSTA